APQHLSRPRRSFTVSARETPLGARDRQHSGISFGHPDAPASQPSSRFPNTTLFPERTISPNVTPLPWNGRRLTAARTVVIPPNLGTGGRVFGTGPARNGRPLGRLAGVRGTGPRRLATGATMDVLDRFRLDGRVAIVTGG